MFLMDENLNSKSVNRKISALKTYFRYLRKENVIKNNPMIKVLPPKTKKILPEYVNQEHMQKLFEENMFEVNFCGTRNRLIIEMFYLTGIRLSELVELKNTDIDLNNKYLKVLGKRNKERIIPFGNKLEESMTTYINFRDEKFGHPNGSNSFFLTEKGTKIYQKLVYRIVNLYLSKVSTIKKKSPHILRHTFATHMLDRGADLNAIKEILGHANLSATQIYTHNSVEKLKTIYNQAHPRA
jgi:integrase/recombinase XerC